jgi:hypothetical protein
MYSPQNTASHRPGIDFAAVNRAALSVFPQLLTRWLPDGKLRNGEWEARNPTRDDKKSGSFLINIRTGKWSDFATDDRGGDVISLVAYLGGCTQVEAARQLGEYLGVCYE